MSRYKIKRDEKKHKSRNDLLTKKNLYYLLFGLFIVFFLLYDLIDAQMPRNYYVKELKVETATVAETKDDGSKYSIRVSPSIFSRILDTDPENMWIEVTPEFYRTKGYGDSVGVLFANIDVFKKRYWGLFGDNGQSFEGSYWEPQEIYPNYDDAAAANPVKQYTANATVKKKRISKQGSNYLIMESDGRTYSNKVEPALYDKYAVGQSVSCEFESVGDLVRLVKINE